MTSTIESFLEANNIKSKKLDSAFEINAENTEQITKILIFANSQKIPVLFNYSTEVQDDLKPKNTEFIFLTFKNFKNIDEINISNRYVIVDPCVKTRELNDELEKDNCCFLPFLGENLDLNIGQLLYQNYISNMNVKTSDYVLGLEVILPSGEYVKTGSKTLKSVSGYDITSLYIGSQGIFGIIIKGILRIDPILEHKVKDDPIQNYEKKFNEGEIKILRKLKNVIDPNNILNPNSLI